MNIVKIFWGMGGLTQYFHQEFYIEHNKIGAISQNTVIETVEKDFK